MQNRGLQHACSHSSLPAPCPSASSDALCSAADIIAYFSIAQKAVKHMKEGSAVVNTCSIQAVQVTNRCSRLKQQNAAAPQHGRTPCYAAARIPKHCNTQACTHR